MCRLCQNARDTKKYQDKCAGKLEVKNKTLTFEEINQILALAQRGKGLKEIADLIGTSKQVVSYQLKKANIAHGNQIYVIPDAVKTQIVDLRKAGMSRADIAVTFDLKVDAVDYVARQAGVKLTPEQRINNSGARIYTKEQEQQILDLRKQGLDREEIAGQLGVRLSKIKSLLNKEGLVLSMEERQRNVHAAKFLMNPAYIEDMRKGLTPEVIARRAITLAETYANNPALRDLKGQQTRAWWDAMPEQEKKEYLAKRSEALKNSEQAKAYLGRSLEEGEDFASRLHSIAKANGGEFVGEYVASKTLTQFKCSEGHLFDCIPNAIQQGAWCARCANVGPSKAQVEIYDYIKSLIPDQEVILGDRKVISPKELDIYIPHLKLGIEYNGLYWHSDALDSEARQMGGRHLAKYVECEKVGVKILAVFQDEWKSKPDLIKAMIRQRLGAATGVKLDARKLTLKILEKNVQFESFFEEFHLEGHAMASFAHGLFLGDKMVMCASFRTNSYNEFEIARMATDYNYIVRGGAGRVVSGTKRPLMTYSNNRVGAGEVYQKLGFRLLKKVGANYWYTDGSSRIGRQKCRRDNTPEILALYPTEKDQALNGVFSEKHFGDKRPLYKVEDYGHCKWILEE